MNQDFHVAKTRKGVSPMSQKVYSLGEWWGHHTSERSYTVSKDPIKLSRGTRLVWSTGQLPCFLPFRLPHGPHVPFSPYGAIVFEVGLKLHVFTFWKVQYVPMIRKCRWFPQGTACYDTWVYSKRGDTTVQLEYICYIYWIGSTLPW